tara:strand:- start:60 stop:428 length:369 start_codon:yes stop_codon:yes gene_type:complete
MPTQRRRIGFLPRTEVQNIIDKICDHNKLSQSKVTGILVEEALISRGVLNTSIQKLSFNFFCNNNEDSLTVHKAFNSEMPNDEDNINLEDGSMNHEVQMINDFIEFKFFKNIMEKNNRKIMQ